MLGWLFTHPDERYFVRQLTVLLGEDSTNVSRELARLEKTGILILTTEGKQKYYKVNAQNPIFNELHGLIRKTVGVADVLRLALAPALPARYGSLIPCMGQMRRSVPRKKVF